MGESNFIYGDIDNLKIWNCVNEIMPTGTVTPTNTMTQTITGTTTATLTGTITKTLTVTPVVSATVTPTMTYTTTPTITPMCVCVSSQSCFTVEDPGDPSYVPPAYQYNFDNNLNDSFGGLNAVANGNLIFDTGESGNSGDYSVGGFLANSAWLSLCPCQLRQKDCAIEWDEYIDPVQDAILYQGNQYGPTILDAVLGQGLDGNSKGIGVFLDEDGTNPNYASIWMGYDLNSTDQAYLMWVGGMTTAGWYNIRVSWTGATGEGSGWGTTGAVKLVVVQDGVGLVGEEDSPPDAPIYFGQDVGGNYVNIGTSDQSSFIYGDIDNLKIWNCMNEIMPTGTITPTNTITPTVTVTTTATKTNTITKTPTRTTIVSATASPTMTYTVTETVTPMCACVTAQHCFTLENPSDPSYVPPAYQYNFDNNLLDSFGGLNAVGNGPLIYGTGMPGSAIGGFVNGGWLSLCPCQLRQKDCAIEWDEYIDPAYDASHYGSQYGPAILDAVLGQGVGSDSSSKGIGVFLDEDGSNPNYAKIRLGYSLNSDSGIYIMQIGGIAATGWYNIRVSWTGATGEGSGWGTTGAVKLVVVQDGVGLVGEQDSPADQQLYFGTDMANEGVNIGTDMVESNFINGYIDNLKIWNCMNEILPTGTITPTNTVTPTVTGTYTLTLTSTTTQTSTLTPIVSPTSTPTVTYTFTPTATPMCMCVSSQSCFTVEDPGNPSYMPPAYQYNFDNNFNDSFGGLNAVANGNLIFDAGESGNSGDYSVGGFLTNSAWLSLCPCQLRQKDCAIEWDEYIDPAYDAGYYTSQYGPAILDAVLGQGLGGDSKGIAVFLDEDGTNPNNASIRVGYDLNGQGSAYNMWVGGLATAGWYNIRISWTGATGEGSGWGTTGAVKLVVVQDGVGLVGEEDSPPEDLIYFGQDVGGNYVNIGTDGTYSNFIHGDIDNLKIWNCMNEILPTGTITPTNTVTPTITMTSTLTPTGTPTVTVTNTPGTALIVNVDSDEDGMPGSVTPGANTLRQCINAANALAGPVTITFDPVIANTTITLGSDLPVIYNTNITLTIDGGSNGIVVNGATYRIFSILTSNNIIDNLAMVGGYWGVVISGQSGAASGNMIFGCNIGVDWNNNAVANQYGVVLEQNANENYIGLNSGSGLAYGNIISGNTYDGVYIDGCSNNWVVNNFIGTDSTGMTAIPNGYDGVHLANSAYNNTIGYYDQGLGNMGNVISGNTDDGIYIENGAENTGVFANVIGGNAGVLAGNSATAGAMANGYNGIEISQVDAEGDGADYTGIGNYNPDTGLYDQPGNTIMANTYSGIYISSNSSMVFAGSNSIGIMFGNTAAGNVQTGITIDTPAYDNYIQTNLIGGQGNKGSVGIEINGTNGYIYQNIIGLNGAMSTAVPNFAGIYLYGASNVQIGQQGNAGSANVIAGNTVQGILIDNGSTYNGIYGNYIGTDTNLDNFGNGQEGIAIINGSSNNQIGSGVGSGDENYILDNLTGGVIIGASPLDTAAVGNMVDSNYISNNNGLGIDLGNDGITVNGSEPASGPNNFVYYPAINNAQMTGPTTLHVDGDTNITDGSDIGVIIGISDNDGQQGTDNLSHGECLHPIAYVDMIGGGGGGAFSADIDTSAFGDLTGRIITSYNINNSGSSEFSANAAVLAMPTYTFTITPTETVVISETVTQTITPTPTFTITVGATPIAPAGLSVTQNGANTTLQWGTAGDAVSYNIYTAAGAAGKFNTFPGAGWTKIATAAPTAGTTTYTYADASGNAYIFYLVTAQNGAGEGMPSAMGAKVIMQFNYIAGTTNTYRVSLPYVSKYTKAGDIVTDIEGSLSTDAKINRIALWDHINQVYNPYSYKMGTWIGTNWAVDAGTSSSNAFAAYTMSSFAWTVAGTDTSAGLGFAYNPAITNGNVRMLPYTGTYTKASDIVTGIEGGTGPGTNTKINRIAVWDSVNQIYVPYSYKASMNGWVGTDSQILPGMAVDIYLSGNTGVFTWTPKLVTP